MTNRRVVITGMGAITPLGLSAADLWSGIKTGRCGISTVKAFDPVGFPCKIAGQIPEFKTANYIPKSYRKSVKLMARDIEIAVVAAKEAIDSSGLITKGVDETKVNIDPTRFGVNIGAGLMSCELLEVGPGIEKSITDGKFDIKKWGREGMESLTPLWLLKYLPNMLACHISIIHDLQGPSNTITVAEVSSHIAIAEAMQTIQRGSADIELAGGGEAKINVMSLMRQCINGRSSCKCNDSPETACRPFAADADGCIFGEGAGMIVLEDYENAKKRGAKIYGEMVGSGHSHSVNRELQHIEPDGTGLRIAIEQAIADAKISASQIDLVIPHGTGIPVDDLAEARAIEAALGTGVPVLPTKSMLSNISAGSGAVDVITAVMAMNEHLIPAAKNCKSKAKGININVNTSPKSGKIRYALCCGYTYGGQTAALVIKNAEVD